MALICRIFSVPSVKFINFQVLVQQWMYAVDHDVYVCKNMCCMSYWNVLRVCVGVGAKREPEQRINIQIKRPSTNRNQNNLKVKCYPTIGTLKKYLQNKQIAFYTEVIQILVWNFKFKLTYNLEDKSGWENSKHIDYTANVSMTCRIMCNWCTTMRYLFNKWEVCIHVN